MTPLILILASLALPVALAYALARRRAGTNPFAVSGIAALPMGVMFVALAVYLRSSVSQAACTAQACSDPAPFWIGALAVWGTVSLLVGFGLGMFGHSLGNRRHRQ